MFQSICYTDPSLLRTAILNAPCEGSNILIDLSSVHSHTDFVKKYPVSNFTEHPQFDVKALLEGSPDLLFTVDYFLLYMLRLSPEVSKIQPREFNETIHNAFTNRNHTNVTAKSLVSENFDSLTYELNNYIKTIADLKLEHVEWGGNYIKLLKPKGLYPILHYLYEFLASAFFDERRKTQIPEINHISIIDTEGKLFNEAFTNALIPILNRLKTHRVLVTHNHCCYQHDYRKWEYSICKELVK